MRSYIEVNLKDLKENYLQISRYLKKEIIAVVKSNAYGHGIIEVSKTLYKSGVHSFLVATKEEALLLRKHFPNVTIILLEPSLEFKSLYENKICFSLHRIGCFNGRCNHDLRFRAYQILALIFFIDKNG